MPQARHWILQTAVHITETNIWQEGGDLWDYDVSPDYMVKKGDVLYLWLNQSSIIYAWGEVVETPQIITVEGPVRGPDGELIKRRRQRIKVHRKKQFKPAITGKAMLSDPNLRKFIPDALDDLYALSITKVQANYLNDFAREYGLDGPEGSEAVSIKIESSPQFMLKAVLGFGDKTDEGRLVEAVLLPWYHIIDKLLRDPEEAYRIPPHKWEEIIAGVYKAAGFDEVILTPRSGDCGRDVIAEKKGSGFIRVIDQVKAYKPGHLVTANDVRALAGVLAMEQVSKGFLTTTSDFAPRIRLDPLIEHWIPSKLELVDGSKLIKRLAELRSARKPPMGLIVQ